MLDLIRVRAFNTWRSNWMCRWSSDLRRRLVWIPSVPGHGDLSPHLHPETLLLLGLLLVQDSAAETDRRISKALWDDAVKEFRVHVMCIWQVRVWPVSNNFSLFLVHQTGHFLGLVQKQKASTHTWMKALLVYFIMPFEMQVCSSQNNYMRSFFWQPSFIFNCTQN